jgi:hypothetical protein
MILNISTKFRENFIEASAKEKFCRTLYLLLVIPLALIGVPIYFVASVIEVCLEKLNDWLW